MADATWDTQSAPVTPSTGQATLYVDNITKRFSIKDDSGFVQSLSRTNFSTASQLVNNTTRAYITGTALSIPTNKVQIGTMFRWKFSMTKTAAGIATSTFDVCVGTNGTTADTARISFTKPAGTGVADEAWVEINVTVRGPLSASGICVGEFQMIHNLSATGHAVIPCVCVNTVSAAFDVTIASLIFGVCVTAGASDALTFQMVQSEVINV